MNEIEPAYSSLASDGSRITLIDILRANDALSVCMNSI